MTSSSAAEHPLLPAGFRFGTSTASYQVEGAVAEDGRGPSIWDTFTAEPGRIVDGSSGAVACDHYHRYAEDVALMQRLGVGGYRFSIAWPRVQPTGRGPVNAAGLDFYDRLVDALLAAGVAPMATLYHWDLPQALQDEGGWMTRSTAGAFGEYAAVVGARLADRVAQWCPVNEPNVVTLLGHGIGLHAPGQALMFDALPVAHHLLLGHGLAVRALRAAGAQEVGTANNHTPVWPASEDPEDVAAADLYDTLWNRLFADPLLLGRYPEGFAELMPAPPGGDLADDLATISAPLDFYGVNYYNPTAISAPGRSGDGTGGAIGEVEVPAGLPFEFARMSGYETTDFGWPIVPAGLREQLNTLRERYPDVPPMLVTEQGCSYAVGPDESGRVADTARIAYYDAHLRAVADAIGDGCDVRGYYAWSLVDNFEWAEGYTQRFGLVWVDFETQERVPKASFDWFAAMIAAQPRA